MMQQAPDPANLPPTTALAATGRPAWGTTPESATAEYEQVCTNFRALADTRFKLLGFLPVATVAGILLTDGAEGIASPLITAIGTLTTVAVWVYNERNNQLYFDLVQRAAELERLLRLPDGAFATRPGARFEIDLKVKKAPIEHDWPVRVLYTASLIAWLGSFFVAMWNGWLEAYPTIGIPVPDFLNAVPEKAYAFWNAVGWFALATVLVVAADIRVRKKKKDREAAVCWHALEAAKLLAENKGVDFLIPQGTNEGEKNDEDEDKKKEKEKNLLSQVTELVEHVTALRTPRPDVDDFKATIARLNYFLADPSALPATQRLATTYEDTLLKMNCLLDPSRVAPAESSATMNAASLAAFVVAQVADCSMQWVVDCREERRDAIRKPKDYQPSLPKQSREVDIEERAKQRPTLKLVPIGKDALLEELECRFGKLSKPEREKVLSGGKAEVERWARKMSTTSKLEELLDAKQPSGGEVTNLKPSESA